jgi:hypothetical protein
LEFHRGPGLKANWKNATDAAQRQADARLAIAVRPPRLFEQLSDEGDHRLVEHRNYGDAGFGQPLACDSRNQRTNRSIDPLPTQVVLKGFINILLVNLRGLREKARSNKSLAHPWQLHWLQAKYLH